MYGLFGSPGEQGEIPVNCKAVHSFGRLCLGACSGFFLFASPGRAQTTHFDPEQTITTLVDGARSVIAADLDGDGDQDVLSASEFDSKIAWYENLTPPNAALHWELFE